MGTPIPLPDQTLLLGLGVGKKSRRGTKKKRIRPKDRSANHTELRPSQHSTAATPAVCLNA
jgi:hypothetical protein